MASRRALILQTTLAGLLGLALLAVLLIWAGPQEIADTLAEADPLLLSLAFLLYSSQTLTMGLRWWLGMRLLGHRASFVSLLRANSAGNVINFVAPGHLGEPLVSAWLGRSGRAGGVEAFTVLVASKGLSMLLNAFLVLGCLPLLVSESWRQSPGSAAALIAGAIAGTAIGFALLVNKPVSRLVAQGLSFGCRLLLGRVGQRDGRSLGDRLAERSAAVVERFRATFSLLLRRPLALVAVVGTSLLKIGTLVAAIHFIYAAFGSPLGPTELVFLQSVDAVGALLSIWIPGNLGVQEAILTGAAVGGFGTGEALAASASVALKAILIVHTVFGAILVAALAPWDRASAEA